MSSKPIVATMFIVVACGSLLVDLKAVQAQDGCAICTALASTAETLLNQGQSQDQIVEAMKQQCRLVPVLENTCLELVDDDSSIIIDQLFQIQNDPGAVCRMTGNCT